MWTNRNRQTVLNEFKNILQKVHPDIQPFEEKKIIYFGQFGLCTMVNSVTYVDDDIGIRKDPSGVDELILGIAKSLDQQNRCTWLQAMNRDDLFWSRMTFEAKNSSTMSQEMTINGNMKDKQSSFSKDFSQAMGFEKNADCSSHGSNSWECDPPSSSNSESQENNVINDNPDDSLIETSGQNGNSSNETTLPEKTSNNQVNLSSFKDESRIDSISSTHGSYFDECAHPPSSSNSQSQENNVINDNPDDSFIETSGQNENSSNETTLPEKTSNNQVNLSLFKDESRIDSISSTHGSYFDECARSHELTMS
ncbi:unnamed protein product [Adineta ricciae]|uniref:Uncharacterized protein n=1 Tax=Adineta ricciae TaxID=249248 RepID=A0A815WYA1_ADIRI|nr:unnamed protein product [Adineta ricciae]